MNLKEITLLSSSMAARIHYLKKQVSAPHKAIMLARIVEYETLYTKIQNMYDNALLEDLAK